MTSKLFSELGLSEELLKGVDRLGFEQSSPIQAEAIPVLLQGRDVVGQSQTGSGKTAAFGIPVIERIDVRERAVQALILCPTRELAVQVSEEIHKLAFFKRGVHALPIYGGQSYERQIYGLRQGAQIVIGTPGRLMDHMRRGTLRLDQTRIVVLDEADVMLDMGFRDDIEFILQAVPTERQTVFFSATMPRPIQDLIRKYARDPQNVRIEQKALTVPTVEQMYYEVDRRFKVELLTRLIDIHDLKLGIIFCNTKRMVDDLVDHLNAQGYSADRQHGDMSQGLRDRVMNKFRKSGLEFLVATDVAARGIDVDDVQVVFNYDLPYDVEDYVHRIGRTGRAGRSGRAISFVAGRELFQIQQIERYTKTRIQRSKAPTPSEVEEARTAVFLDKLRTTLRGGDFKKQDHVIELLLEEGFNSTDIASALIHLLQRDDGRSAGNPSATENFENRRRGPVGNEDRFSRFERGHPQDRRTDRGNRFERPDRRERPGRPDRSAGSERTEIEREPHSHRPSEPRLKRAESSRTPTNLLPTNIVPLEPSPVAEKKSGPMDRSLPTSSESSVGTLAGAVPADEPASPKRPLPFPDRRKPSAPLPQAPKVSHRTPKDQTRLHLNAGEEMGLTAETIIRTIQGETGLPASVIGHVDLRARHAFIDVKSEHAHAITSKLSRAQIAGHRVKIKGVNKGEKEK